MSEMKPENSRRSLESILAPRRRNCNSVIVKCARGSEVNFGDPPPEIIHIKYIFYTAPGSAVDFCPSCNKIVEHSTEVYGLIVTSNIKTLHSSDGPVKSQNILLCFLYDAENSVNLLNTLCRMCLVYLV